MYAWLWAFGCRGEMVIPWSIKFLSKLLAHTIDVAERLKFYQQRKTFGIIQEDAESEGQTVVVGCVDVMGSFCVPSPPPPKKKKKKEDGCAHVAIDLVKQDVFRQRLRGSQHPGLSAAKSHFAPSPPWRCLLHSCQW